MASTDPESFSKTAFNDMVNSRSYYHRDPYIIHRQTESRQKMVAINAEADEDKRARLLADFFTLTKPDNKVPPSY